MAAPVEWQNDAVEPVLRLLYQSGVAVTLDGVLVNLDSRMDDPPDRDRVVDALERLSERQFVRIPDESGAYYQITESGRDYVETEVDQDAPGLH